MNKIIAKLRGQHEELRSHVAAVTVVASRESFPAGEIVTALAELRTRLDEHLALEDTEFYPELLRAMKDDAMDASVTEEFIAQMVAIGTRVYGFLDTYATAAYTAMHADEFRTELAEISNALSARMAAEDRSVYTLYEQLRA